MTELKYTTYSDTHFSKNIHRQMPILSNVFVIYFSSIVVLTLKGQFLYCTTVAFSERYYFQMVTEKKKKKTGTPWNAVLKSSLPVSLGLVDLTSRKESVPMMGTKHQQQDTSAELSITCSGCDDVSTNCTASTNDRQHEGSSVTEIPVQLHRPDFI